MIQSRFSARPKYDIYENSGPGIVRCKLCGKDGLTRTEQALSGHLKSKKHLKKLGEVQKEK